MGAVTICVKNFATRFGLSAYTFSRCVLVNLLAHTDTRWHLAFYMYIEHGFARTLYTDFIRELRQERFEQNRSAQTGAATLPTRRGAP